MNADWKFSGTVRLTSGPSAAEALRRRVARLDAPGRSRFGLLSAPPEIASLWSGIPADSGERAMDVFGNRLTGMLDRISPQGGGKVGAPSSRFSKTDMKFIASPKQPRHGKSLGADGGEVAQEPATSIEAESMAKNGIAPIEPNPAQLRAIFQRHGIDPTNRHGRQEMEAHGPNPKTSVAQPTVSPHRAPPVAIPTKPNNPGTGPQIPGAIFIATHGNEFLVERKSPLEIHAHSLTEGRSAAVGASMAVARSVALTRNDLLRLARPERTATETEETPIRPGPGRFANPPQGSGGSNATGPSGGRIAKSSPPFSGPEAGRVAANNSMESGPRWTRPAEESGTGVDPATDFRSATSASSASERPVAPGQLGQLLARWENRTPAETPPSHRRESAVPEPRDSRFSPSPASERWIADPDEFARRVEDTLESVLIREIRRHGLDPEKP